jgi:hypothetical protein
MNKVIFTFILLFALYSPSSAQNPGNVIIRSAMPEADTIAKNDDVYILRARIKNNDTLYIADLPTFTIVKKYPRKFKAALKRHDKLVRNVKKVYPYAKIAGLKLCEYEVLLKDASSDRERRKLMKQAEKELKEQFEGDITKLTFSQGIILIKLIDRETGNSSYVLIQELRGKVIAFFWQSIARLFGYNLKSGYDPEGEDREIEYIVQQIERGEI